MRTPTELGSGLIGQPSQKSVPLPSVHLPCLWSLTVFFCGVPSSRTPDGAQQQTGRRDSLAGSSVLPKRYVRGALGSRRITAEVTAEADRVYAEDCSRPSRKPTGIFFLVVRDIPWSLGWAPSNGTYSSRWHRGVYVGGQ